LIIGVGSQYINRSGLLIEIYTFWQTMLKMDYRKESSRKEP